MIKGVYKNVETDLDKKLLKTEFSTATAVFIRVTKICCSRQGVKLRLIQAPMRLNFSLWRPNPEN